MSETWKSLRTYLVLVAYLAAVKLLLPVIQPRFPLPEQEGQFSWTFLLTLAGLGCSSTILYVKTGFPSMWENGLGSAKRLVLPVAVGAASAIPLMALDLGLDAGAVAARNLDIPSIHMPLPESVLIYPAAAIIVETLFRLLPMSVLVWLVSTLLLRGRAIAPAFSVTAVAVAAVEPIQQLSLFRGATVLLWLYLPYSYALNLLQMYFFQSRGFIAALAQRMGTKKATPNLQNHGVSFEEAVAVFGDLIGSAS